MPSAMHVPEGTAQQRIVAAPARLASLVADLRPDEVRGLLLSICPRIQVHADRVEVTIDRLALVRRLEQQAAGGRAMTASERPPETDALRSS